MPLISYIPVAEFKVCRGWQVKSLLVRIMAQSSIKPQAVKKIPIHLSDIQTLQ